MTRDEAIEAGARAIFIRDARELIPEEAHRAEVIWALAGETRDSYRAEAAAVLDAIGWYRREITLEAQDRAVATLHAAGHAAVTRRDLQRAIGRLLPGCAPAVEPVGYVVAIDDTDFPGAIYGGGVWHTVEEALKYGDSGERVWGLIPVEGAIELDANEGGA